MIDDSRLIGARYIVLNERYLRAELLFGYLSVRLVFFGVGGMDCEGILDEFRLFAALVGIGNIEVIDTFYGL